MGYDQAAGRLVCDFLELLTVPETGAPFRLMQWQRDAIMRFYTNVREDGLRAYRYLYLEIPKKNGKSGLAAGLALYHTFMDGEKRGEVYAVAADRDNAGIVFNASLAMLEACPSLKKRAHVIESQKIIRDRVSGTVYKVLSSEAYSKHGYKPSCVIFDELHAQPNRELWDIMTFGAGAARKQPCWLVLTTAGDDPNRKSIGWEIHEKARKILKAREGFPTTAEAGRQGTSSGAGAPPSPGGKALGEEGEVYEDNPAWLPIIYGYDGEDIWNEENWKKANPSLGVTLSWDTVRQEALDARQSPGVERLFRWLRLNQWLSVKEVGWLPLTTWDATETGVGREQLRGKTCYLGLDCSTTNDLTAVTAVFPPQRGLEKWTAIFEAWIPEANVIEREHADHVPYRQWAAGGYIHITPGDAVDYTAVEEKVLALKADYDVQALGVDPWNSRMLTQRLMQKGVDVVEIQQTMGGMSPAMKDMERLMRKGEMLHERTPAGRWCFGNVRISTDGNENIKPMKDKSVDRIDIVVSWIIAVAMARQRTDMEAGVYEWLSPRMIEFDEG